MNRLVLDAGQVAHLPRSERVSGAVERGGHGIWRSRSFVACSIFNPSGGLSGAGSSMPASNRLTTLDIGCRSIGTSTARSSPPPCCCERRKPAASSSPVAACALRPIRISTAWPGSWTVTTPKSAEVRSPTLAAGALNVFKGRNTAHRTSPVIGPRERIRRLLLL